MRVQIHLFPVKNFGKLALEEADVELEAVTLPHLDGKEVVVVLLGLSTGGVWSEEHLDYLLKVAEIIWRQRVKLI